MVPVKAYVTAEDITQAVTKARAVAAEYEDQPHAITGSKAVAHPYLLGVREVSLEG